MSIQIQTADGRKVYDDDLGAQISIAQANGTEVPITAILDHLELIGQVPEAYGESTAFAARAILKIYAEHTAPFVDLGDVPAGI